MPAPRRAADRSEAFVGVRLTKTEADQLDGLRGPGESRSQVLRRLIVAAARPPAPGPDAYPERERALAKLRGILPREVEAALRSTVVHGPPLSEAEWLELASVKLRNASPPREPLPPSLARAYEEARRGGVVARIRSIAASRGVSLAPFEAALVSGVRFQTLLDIASAIGVPVEALLRPRDDEDEGRGGGHAMGA